MTTAALALALSLSLQASANEDKREVIGEKEQIGNTTVKIDTTRSGTTVRGEGKISPSVTFSGEKPTRSNPKGEGKATFGVTIETD